MLAYFLPQKTLILADGELPSLGLIKQFLSQKETFIALDGAASWLLHQGISPDLVIGDMDSIPEKELLRLPFIKSFDQETNDLEKALSYCEDLGLKDISLLGAFGLRADHFLTNMAILARFSHLNIAMIDDQQIAFICPLNQKIDFSLPKGSYISLFPLNEKVGPIWTTGVDYPLKGETLSINGRLGTLNRINEEDASISCAAGSLLVLAPWQATTRPLKDLYLKAS